MNGSRWGMLMKTTNKLWSVLQLKLFSLLGGVSVVAKLNFHEKFENGNR